MKRFRRITLAMLALSILAVSLVFNSGVAHAQTRTELAPQHVTMPAYSGWTGTFDYGWWLYGACISHTDMQAILGNPTVALSLPGAVQILGTVVKLSKAANIVGGAMLLAEGYLESLDHGQGVCIDLWFRYIPQVFSQ